jgi:glucan biosynthesis protein C
MNRRHDIDALRALAFALVILYHLGMYYVAGWGWHLKSPHAAEWLQLPMRALNLWRMDLVFLVSGLAFGFLLSGASGGAELWRQRSARLLLPLAFGMAVVVPYQPYAQMVANGVLAPSFGDFLLRYFSGGPWPRGAFEGWEVGVTWNHLWYLPYLWLYTTLLIALLPLLDSAAGRQLSRAFAALRGWRLAVLPLLPLLAYTVVLWPRFPVITHDLIHDGWAHAVYFTLFLYGYWIGTDTGWWAEALRLRWRMLAAAALLLVLHFALRGQLTAASPLAARLLARAAADAYLWCALLAVLGWAHRGLNRPWPWLAWANESVYPWYVLHQTLIIVAIAWVAPLRLGPVAEPILLLVLTVAGCWSITALVRRSDILRPLFGLRRAAVPLRRRAPLPRPSPATPADPGAHSGAAPARPCRPGTW